jgi:putative transposase
MCKILKVSRSAYYQWRHRVPSTRAQRNDHLRLAIGQSHEASGRIYGSPRVHRDLVEQGLDCDVKTVAKIMKTHGIRSEMRKQFVTTTDSHHDYPAAPNRLNRCFEQDQPNHAWVSDITYIPTRQGWMYLAVVLDLWSRRVVGWSLADHLRSELVEDALEMAVQSRRPTGQVICHSDRGVQYASGPYQTLLSKHGLLCSMSRKGNCWDNAPAESFFGTLKTELVHHCDYATHAEARQSIFKYIEFFYNRRRRHSAIGYMTPANYESAA